MGSMRELRGSDACAPAQCSSRLVRADICTHAVSRTHARRLAQHFVNNLWAIASTTPFYSVEARATQRRTGAAALRTVSASAPHTLPDTRLWLCAACVSLHLIAAARSLGGRTCRQQPRQQCTWPTTKASW